MRLWHKDLIEVLPKKQLISQWRECCAIARNIAVNGSPNHILVNKIMDYPKWHFERYTDLVCKELEKRGYKINRDSFYKWICQWKEEGSVKYLGGSNGLIFKEWHNDRYLMQCYYNLQEKYDCGGISNEEWFQVVVKMNGVSW